MIGNRLLVRPAPNAPVRILVVEDNEINRQVLLAELRTLGHSAEVAGNGMEALARLDEKTFDLVLMDCQMPGMDGYEATRRLREREAGGSHTIVIAVTAHAMREDRERCLAAGMDDYLAKPYRLEQLATILGRYLESAPAVPLDAPGGGTDSGALNPETIAQLRAMENRSGQPILAPLAKSFPDNAARQVSAMRQALATADPGALEQAAHTLKGSAAILGAGRLARECAAIEDLAGRGELGACEEIVAQAEKELAAVMAALGALSRGPGV